jgi:hypothetical protein
MLLAQATGISCMYDPPVPLLRSVYTQGFYWLPSLAGPVSVANRGIEWLYPFVDGAPPIGWEAAQAYLVLPVVLVILQVCHLHASLV